MKNRQSYVINTSHMYSVSVSALMSSGRTSFPSYGPIQVPAGIRFLAHTPYPTQGMLDVQRQTSSGNLRMEPFSKGLWDWPALTSFRRECNGPCIGHSPSCFSLHISHPRKGNCTISVRCWWHFEINCTCFFLARQKKQGGTHNGSPVVWPVRMRAAISPEHASGKHGQLFF